MNNASTVSGNEVVHFLFICMLLQIAVGLLIGYVWYKCVVRRKSWEVGEMYADEEVCLPPKIREGTIEIKHPVVSQED